MNVNLPVLYKLKQLNKVFITGLVVRDITCPNLSVILEHFPLIFPFSLERSAHWFRDTKQPKNVSPNPNDDVNSKICVFVCREERGLGAGAGYNACCYKEAISSGMLTNLS